MDVKTLLSMTTDIVASHAASNELTQEQLLEEIQNVLAKLAALAGVENVECVPILEGAGLAGPTAPAVPLDAAFGADKVFCMVCGQGMKTLKRHLATAHELKPGAYRKKFGNDWDFISIGINPDRQTLMNFSAPYSQIEIGILVGKDSPVTSMAELDRRGVRIAVLERGDSDVLLTPTLKQATLIRTQAIGDSVAMVRSGKADATSALKTFLIPASEQVPGSRILDGRIAVQDIALGVKPKGNDVGARYVPRFIDEMKASGYVKASIERARVRGVMAAP